MDLLKKQKYLLIRKTSNILNFINLPPKDNLLIEGDIILNPDEKTYDNFILKNSEIEANIFLELPFQVSATNLMIQTLSKLKILILIQTYLMLDYCLTMSLIYH